MERICLPATALRPINRADCCERRSGLGDCPCDRSPEYNRPLREVAAQTLQDREIAPGGGLACFARCSYDDPE